MSAPPIVLPSAPLVDGPTALRQWREQDLGALRQITPDPDIIRWIGLPPTPRDADARAYLMSRFDGLHAGIRAPLAIVAREHDRLLGSIALSRFQWDELRAEVGYWLAPGARGGGHATRAVRMICEWGFEALGLGRIELQAAVDNAASQRVAQRLGFTREAVLRSRWTTYDGERHDMVCFGLLADG